MNGAPLPTVAAADEDYRRLPGLYRRWELERVIEPGVDFRIEEAGTASDGTPLYAVYRRELNNEEEDNE
jgi:hypothetical protein